ncbi:MAG: CPBP family intramembrane metalloprotease [Oscillospiraceae bacterium]|jgi:membrane protease YdiL (CAAX protease family)|nr:CPBP family intramembrane metalloprotease [Oscillospiraceae bacterium]
MNALSDLQRDKYGLKAVFHTVIGILMLFAGGLLASLPVERFFGMTESDTSVFNVAVRPLLVISAMLLLVSLYIRKVLKRPLRDFRIRRPNHIVLWSACAFILPLAVSAFYIFLTPGNFFATDYTASERGLIILRAVFRSGLSAGIIEELLFRGLIMRVLEIRWGKSVAVVVPSVLFALSHIGNMDSPRMGDILLLVVAGTAVGSMFSLVAMQSGSIWASAVVHGIWNLIIGGKILDISPAPSSSAIFTYRLMSGSKLLTGGMFGIDAALPAIAGYCCVILLALCLSRRNGDDTGSSEIE